MTNLDSEEPDSLESKVLDYLAKEVGEWAEGHGFRDDWNLANDLENIGKMLRETTDVSMDVTIGAAAIDGLVLILNQSAEALRTNYIGTKLMLIVSEASEAMERLRDIGARGVLEGDENFTEEISDIHIRLFDLTQMTKIKVGCSVITKIIKNRARPFKHGRKL